MLSSFTSMTADLQYPMFLVTAAAGGDRDGCLVGFTTQCSIHPARFLVCLSDKNRTTRIAMEADLVGVHLLADTDRELADLFGGETGDDVDKLSRWPWSAGPDGVPILEGPSAWFLGRVLDRVVLGDHIGMVLEPVEAHHTESVRALSSQEVRDIDPGHPA